MSLDIKGFIETSLIDWDGKVVSVVFLPGCNFRCPYCHNIDLADHPEKFKSIPEEKIFDYLESHRDFIDGICITGGEATLHKDKGLTEFIKKIKQKGFLVKLDTNGTDPDYMKELVRDNLIDFVAMDVKAPLEDYNKAANVKVNTEAIKESIAFLLSGNVDHEFRTTVAPTITGPAEIEGISKLINGTKKYVIQQFEPENCKDIHLKTLKPVDAETTGKMLEIARKYIENVRYRGK
ncbi:MAG: anaerobic ribonucleoside-triphosphate reductase activating protein [bacterium]